MSGSLLCSTGPAAEAPDDALLGSRRRNLCFEVKLDSEVSLLLRLWCCCVEFMISRVVSARKLNGGNMELSFAYQHLHHPQ